MVWRISMAACLGLATLICPVTGSGSDLLVGPYLQNIKPDGVTIMWETASPAVGKVIYGESVLDRSASEVESATTHEVALEGLRPGTVYRYRCAWGNEISEPAQFTTSPPPGTRECRIAVYGDSRSVPETHALIASLVARQEPDLVLHVGDIVARGSIYELWKREFFDPIHPYASSVTWFTVPGNHEQESPHYYNYVSLPGDESWWSIDYANVHIVGLDSCLPAGEHSEQYRWLVEDLRRNEQEWTIVLFHHPLFNAHPTRSMPSYRWAWQDLFQEHGVDLAISGHDHYYHRTYPIGRLGREPQRGVVHITTGGGGASLYPNVERPYSAYRWSCHHFVLLEIGGDRMVGRTINDKGSVIDAFVLDKQALPSAEEFVSYEALAMESEMGSAVAKAKPVRARGKTCTVEYQLEFETQFQVPTVWRGRWAGQTSWSIERPGFQVRLAAGEPFRIPIRARADSDEVYPLPILRLEGTVDQADRDHTDAPLGFRNRTFSLRPIKVWADQEAKPRRVRRAPAVDGRLDERDWNRAFRIDRFLTNAGTEYMTRKREVYLMTDRERLFVGAQVEQDPARLRDLPYTGRDNRRLERVEHIGIQLWCAGQIYQFIISAAGDVLDMRGQRSDWSCNVEAATTIGPNGWTVEAAIPLTELSQDPRRTDWRINVIGKDGVTGEQGEWIPILSGGIADPFQYAQLDL